MEVEEGVLPYPLNIYPEGATTNGDYLIEFKKGAFFGLNSVQPLAYKYYSNTINTSHDVITIIPHIVIICWAPYTILHMKQYPTFKPNEYFFEHHWDPKSGEEKWQAFARVIRDIIQKGFDFKISNLSMENKLEYKQILKARTPKDKTE